MKTVGRLNLIDENACAQPCKCGWNLQVGGTDMDDLARIKAVLEKEFPAEKEV